MIRNYSFFLFFCLAWSIANPLHANALSDDSLAVIAGQLEVHEQLQGKFEQHKKLHFMATPLLSSGTFSLSRSGGLDWTVTTPVRSHMHVVEGRVTLDGQHVRDRGVGEFMANIMQAFMAGDLAIVEKDFSAQVSSLHEGWQLQLIPKSILVRSVISQIDLRGSHVLQAIAIVEKNGNQTRITFSDVLDVAATAQVRDPGDS